MHGCMDLVHGGHGGAYGEDSYVGQVVCVWGEGSTWAYGGRGEGLHGLGDGGGGGLIAAGLIVAMVVMGTSLWG